MVWIWSSSGLKGGPRCIRRSQVSVSSSGEWIGLSFMPTSGLHKRVFYFPLPPPRPHLFDVKSPLTQCSFHTSSNHQLPSGDLRLQPPSARPHQHPLRQHRTTDGHVDQHVPPRGDRAAGPVQRESRAAVRGAGGVPRLGLAVRVLRAVQPDVEAVVRHRPQRQPAPGPGQVRRHRRPRRQDDEGTGRADPPPRGRQRQRHRRLHPVCRLRYVLTSSPLGGLRGSGRLRSVFLQGTRDVLMCRYSALRPGRGRAAFLLDQCLHDIHARQVGVRRGLRLRGR